jgi:hypothetical protein
MHVLCCYKQTLLEIVGLANRPVGNSQCSEGIARVSGLSVRFVHLFRGGKLKIAECQLQEARIDDARTWMQTKDLYRTQFPREVHGVGRSRPKLTKLSLLPWLTWNKEWNGPFWWVDRQQLVLNSWFWQ